MEKEQIELSDGTKIKGDKFQKSDLKKLQNIYFKWEEINKLVNELGGRKLNIPDVLREGIFCLAYDALRTNGTAYSYDAVSRKTKKGLQLKSACIKNDLSSFGPKSTWDELYFADFSFSKVKGLIEFYEIPNKFIHSAVLNKKKHETFKDQQKQGRRPRLSIRKIINDNKIKPSKIVNIETGEGFE